MNSIEINLVVLLVPVLSSIVAMLLILMDIVGGGESNKKIRIKLGLYLFCSGVSWFASFLYFYNPAYFVYINWLFYLSGLLVPVFLYAFVFDLTITPFSNERFPIAHYFVPIFLSLLLLVLTFIVPVSNQLEIIKAQEEFTGGSKVFYFVTNSKFFVRSLFSVFYMVLSFKRLPPYRKAISNFSSNTARSNLKWITIFLIIASVAIPAHFLFALFSKKEISESSVAIFQASLIVIQQAYLSFHMIKNHFLTQDDLNKTIDGRGEEVVNIYGGEKEIAAITTPISGKIFEEYLFGEKPYLNPHLKITDLVLNLGINRTYISSFINTNYKKNFCSFINHCRLYEFDKIRKDPDFSHISDYELVELAGFNNYRSYKRFISDESNLKHQRIFEEQISRQNI